MTDNTTAPQGQRELAPCPFCGDEPYVVSPEVPGESWQIGCMCGQDDPHAEEVGLVWRDGATIEEATERWNRRAPTQEDGEADVGPIATDVSFDTLTLVVSVTLDTGAVLRIPRHLMQGLAGSRLDECLVCHVMPGGVGVEWPLLDAHFSTAGLIAGRYGNRAWMSAEHPAPYIPDHGRIAANTASAVPTPPSVEVEALAKRVLEQIPADDAVCIGGKPSPARNVLVNVKLLRDVAAALRGGTP